MKSWLRKRRLRSQHAVAPFHPHPSTTSLEATSASETLLSSEIAGNIDRAEDWAKQTEESFSKCSSNEAVDYRAKAEEELACIQRKARQLEHMMLQYQAEHVTPKYSTAATTPKSFDWKMATNARTADFPGDSVIVAPPAMRSRSVSDTTDAFSRGSDALVRQRDTPPALPRRTKSSGTPQDNLQLAAVKREGGKLPNPDSPHACIYCKRVFSTLATAQKIHPTCSVWSCKFLPGIQYVIYPIESNGELEALCCYCNESLGHGQEGRVKSTILKGHMRRHNFRSCDHNLFYSGQCFRQHLQDDHKAINDGTLFAAWMLVVKSCQKQQPSFFEQTEMSLAARRSNTDPGLGNNKDSVTDKVLATPSNFMELTEIPVRTEPNKLRRKRSAITLLEKSSKDVVDILSRSATIDVAQVPSVPPLPQLQPIHSPPSTSKSDASTHWPHIHGVNADFAFYRRRIDASMRNRLYLDDGEEPISEYSQYYFRRIPGSILGGLILHSSLLVAVPMRMTNSVDIYRLNR